MTEFPDGAGETLKHSLRVGELMVQVISELSARSVGHDLSKTEAPEVEVFNEYAPKLKTSTYGSDEYKGFLAGMKPALDHHYAANRHHPEHFPDGVSGMTLADLVEMLADWKAAGERHADGSMSRSLRLQKDRFGLSEQLAKILENTAAHFGWLDRPVSKSSLPTAHCQGLDDVGAPDATRRGEHGAHQWWDIASVSDYWCAGRSPIGSD